MRSTKRVINHIEKFLSPGWEEVFILDKYFLCLFPEDLGIEALTIFMIADIGKHFSEFEVGLHLVFNFCLG